MLINLKGQIIVLDEAHNMEDSAREAASNSVSSYDIREAVKEMEGICKQMKSEY